MIRFMLLADIHLSDGAPEQREDTYFADIMAKLRELHGIAFKLDVAATIIAGDIFHRKNPQHVSHRLVRMLGSVLSGFGTVLTVPGNHDYTGNLEALDRSPYGVLRELGVIHDLHTAPKILSGDTDEYVQISGAAYEPGEPKEMYVPPETSGALEALTVHVCHGMLLPETKSKPFEFTTISQIEDDAARITICGHYHPGWDMQKRGGRIFYTPGALARISTHEHDLKRRPKFGLLTVARVNEKWKAQIKERALRTVRAAGEVFALDAVKAKAAREAELVKFEGSLSPTSLETSVVNVQDAARALARENDLEEPVLAEVLSLLEEAEE